MLELLIGQIPEAIYFSLFMIYTKQLKEKRLLFTILMIAEYLLLKQFVQFNVWFQVLYTFMSFLILKILYKEKSQITDIFTFTIGSIILILCCAVPSFIFLNNKGNYIVYIVYSIVTRILCFSVIFIFRKKLYNLQKLYKKIWNRNDKVQKHMKTTTFRALNVAIFNSIFYIINFAMLYANIYNLIWK